MDQVFIMYIKPDKDGNITMTKEDFEKAIKEAYGKGYSNGYAYGKKDAEQPSIICPSYPSAPISPSPYWPNSTPIITCSAAQVNNTGVKNETPC